MAAPAQHDGIARIVEHLEVEPVGMRPIGKAAARESLAIECVGHSPAW
jgi:hypothetical protein